MAALPSHHCMTFAKRRLAAGVRPNTLPRSRRALRGRYMMTVAASAARSRPYLRIDVLQHLLAPLVLEIDVDVGRLVALARDEALEQHGRPALRIDRSDPRGSSRRANWPQNRVPGKECPERGESDDVVHGEKVQLVPKLGDEGELVLESGALALGHARRPAPAGARLRKLAQVARRALARWHRLVWILVPELVQGKVTRLRHRHRRLEQRRRIQAREAAWFAQVALAVRVQPCAHGPDRYTEANRGERILQAPARARMHVHIAAREQRHAVLRTELRECGEARAIAALAQQFDRDAQLSGEAGREPRQLLGPCRGAGYPEDEAVRQLRCVYIGARQAEYPSRSRAGRG